LARHADKVLFGSVVGLALASHKDFSEVEAWKAEPEVRLPFDSFGGEPRNSDLIIQTRCGSEIVG
jgi:hypothetical protein